MEGKTITVNGKTIEVPDFSLFCQKCGATNFFYPDNKPPYKCDNCGAELDREKEKMEDHH
jgi:rRNA maturation endonuclease Nob1